MVIVPLSKISWDTIKIDWRAFTIPPAIFALFQYNLMPYAFYGTSDNNLTSFAFVASWAFMFIFIWAFYIVIKNMTATQEAVQAKNEVKTLSVEVMEALAHTIDAKDEYTRGHSVRVAKYARMIAERMGKTPEECDDVYYMGLLHDIG